jgi:uncharacterized protein YndB with AHSA1/START domain
MSDAITLAVDVPAAPARVFEILTSTEGQRATWTADCEVSRGSARFGFPGAPADLVTDVATEDGWRVRMRVTSGFPYWEGSAWEWELTEGPEGGTGVLFRHSGFQEGYPEGEFARCAQTWARILDRLADHAAGKQTTPVFPAAGA